MIIRKLTYNNSIWLHVNESLETRQVPGSHIPSTKELPVKQKHSTEWLPGPNQLQPKKSWEPLNVTMFAWSNKWKRDIFCVNWNCFVNCAFIFQTYDKKKEKDDVILTENTSEVFPKKMHCTSWTEQIIIVNMFSLEKRANKFHQST